MRTSAVFIPRLVPRWAGGALLLMSLACIGCGSGETLPTLAPVKGKVTLDGAPLTAGHVALHPEKGDPAVKAPLSAGTIDGSGNYEIFTGGKAGAPLTKYKVVVTPSMVPTQGAAPPAIDQKYMTDKQTPLSYEVVASPTDGQYDLKLIK